MVSCFIFLAMDWLRRRFLAAVPATLRGCVRRSVSCAEALVYSKTIMSNAHKAFNSIFNRVGQRKYLFLNFCKDTKSRFICQIQYLCNCSIFTFIASANLQCQIRTRLISIASKPIKIVVVVVVFVVVVFVVIIIVGQKT